VVEQGVANVRQAAVLEVIAQTLLLALLLLAHQTVQVVVLLLESAFTATFGTAYTSTVGGWWCWTNVPQME
jgi:hypothetical protein